MTRRGTIVRPATPADHPAIAALLDRTFGARPYAQRKKLWAWRYDENPARTDAFPPFLVYDDGGRVAGVHGLIPLRMKVAERHLPVSCSCDLAVEPAARSAGMKLKLAAMGKGVVPLHLSTSANEAANRITLALGGKEVASGRAKLIKPLRVSGLLLRRLPAHARGGRMAAAAAGCLLRPADRILAAMRRIPARTVAARGAFRDVFRFDARFDRFWEEIADESPIAVVRDAAYLTWRYARYPFPGIRSFEVSHGGRLIGFAVVHAAVDEDGLRFAALLELACARSRSDVAAHLLGEAVRRGSEGGAHYLVARSPNAAWEELFRSAGFRRKERETSAVSYTNNADLAEELLSDDRNWYLTLGDGDACYYYAPDVTGSAAAGGASGLSEKDWRLPGRRFPG